MGRRVLRGAGAIVGVCPSCGWTKEVASVDGASQLAQCRIEEKRP